MQVDNTLNEFNCKEPLLCDYSAKRFDALSLVCYRNRQKAVLTMTPLTAVFICYQGVS